MDQPAGVREVCCAGSRPALWATAGNSVHALPVGTVCLLLAVLNAHGHSFDWKPCTTCESQQGSSVMTAAALYVVDPLQSVGSSFALLEHALVGQVRTGHCSLVW